MPINKVGGPGPTGGNPVSDVAHEHVATVRHGETVSDVARRHGVEMKSLLEANPQLKDGYQKLNAGQEIQLPPGPAADRAVHRDLPIVKEWDKATPKLAEAAPPPAPLGDPTTKAVIQGQLSTTQLSEADFAQVQGGVKGASIADKHKDESPAELPTEAVSLNYGKLEPTYTPQKPDGTSGLETKWDLEKAKGA